MLSKVGRAMRAHPTNTSHEQYTNVYLTVKPSRQQDRQEQFASILFQIEASKASQKYLFMSTILIRGSSLRYFQT